ncbi:hypothetical protein GCM10023192_71500 [Amycolatopsis samaneae]
MLSALIIGRATDDSKGPLLSFRRSERSVGASLRDSRSFKEAPTDHNPGVRATATGPAAPRDAFSALTAPRDAFGASNAPRASLGTSPDPARSHHPAQVRECHIEGL